MRLKPRRDNFNRANNLALASSRPHSASAEISNWLRIWNLLTVEELAMIIRDGGLHQIPRDMAARSLRIRNALDLLGARNRTERNCTFSLTPIS